MISWVPLLAVWLVWAIFSQAIPTHLPIAVLDLDHSSASRQLTRMLDATPGLSVIAEVTDPAAAQTLLRRAKVIAVVEIPDDWMKSIKQGQSRPVHALYNAQFANASGLVTRDIRTVVATFSAGVEITARNKRGESILAAQVNMEPLRAGLISLYNTALNYEQFLTVNLVPALLHIFAMTAAVWTVGRELRDGTAGHWMVATQVNSFRQMCAALCAKLLPGIVVLGLIGSGFFIFLLLFRGWQPTGSLAIGIAALWLMLILYSVLGALLVGLLRSLRIGLSAVGFITAPAFAFAGVAFPVMGMPALAQLWANILPFSHYIHLQTRLWQQAAPVLTILPTLFFMLLASSIILVVATFVTRKAFLQADCWGKR